jgi:hypothetical protein
MIGGVAEYLEFQPLPKPKNLSLITLKKAALLDFTSAHSAFT